MQLIFTVHQGNVAWMLKGSSITTSMNTYNAQKSGIQHRAGLRQCSAHLMMHEAIMWFLKREEVRESVKHEALASWVSHLTGEKARVRLNAASIQQCFMTKGIGLR